MYLFKKVPALKRFLSGFQTSNRTIGFVPTMGALHEGHLSLIHSSKSDNNLTICSIFVNPTQFNENTDLEKYPRTPGKDIALLEKVGCDVLFMPGVAEVYPDDWATPPIELGQLAEVMEGAFRPGHFAGVAEVVSRFLSIVEPDALYMGQKDFQQVAVVRSLIQQLNLPVRLVMGETIREKDGLAMSSRNVRLEPDVRDKASVLHQTLQLSKEAFGALKVEDIKKMALDKLNIPNFRPEYFEIVDGHTLQAFSEEETPEMVVACTAVWAGEVRLIDNMVIKE